MRRAINGLLITGLVMFASPFAYAQTGWSSPVNIDNSYQRFSGFSHMDFDSNGYIHVVWSDFSGSDVRIRYSTNMSGSWVKTDVPTPGIDGGRNNCCIIVTPDDIIHIFFQGDGGYGDKTHAWETTKPVGSGSWSTPLQISHNDGGNFDWACEDESGGILAVWVTITFGSQGGANYCRYKPFGGSWGAVEHIETGWNGDWPGNNFVSLGSNGKFYLCYSVDHPYYRVRDASGNIGSRHEINSGGGWAPRVIESPTGELAATWHVDWRNWVKTSSDGGQTWSAKMDFSTSGSDLDKNPVSVFDSEGNLHLTWQKNWDGSGSDVYFRSRVSGTWEAEYSLSPWDIGNAYPYKGSLVARSTDLHMVFPADQSPDDFYDIAYIKKGALEHPATLDSLTLSGDPLVADDTTQHTVTMEATDLDGTEDILDMRWLVNLHGDHAGEYRGYIAWAQTQEGIGRYDDVSNWNISPVDSGIGYWGFYMNNWGSDDYLTIRSVNESTTDNTRTVDFNFTVKPQYYTDGPLSDNDISGLMTHTTAYVGWQNYDLNFNVIDQLHNPVLENVSLNADKLVADDTTVYTLTETTSDGNGYADIIAMRWLINYQGDNAGEYRGYVSWGITPEAIGIYGGTENWDIQPVTSGEGYIGLRMNGWGQDNYIRLVASRETHNGNNRTVAFDFTAKPLFYEHGPLTDNDISGLVQDPYTGTGWLNNDLNFEIYPANFPDYDFDGDIDQSDFAVLQRCITGSGMTPPPTGCESCDLDDDQDVDIYDVAKFNLCATAPGIPADVSCVNLPVEGMLPDKAHNPDPASGTTGLPTSLTLSWSAGTGATSHDVYFGTSNPPTFQVNQTGTTFDPGLLNFNQTYYWRIDEVNNQDVRTGTVWNFTTASDAVTHLNRYVLTNFNTGDEYYLDRTYTISDMPASLEGTLGIKTNNDDRYQQVAQWLTFDLNVPADVYVAYDHRGTPPYGGELPQWLSDDFTDTGMTISVTDSHATPFKLYVRSYDVGQVILGSNFMPPANGTDSNYFVLINPAGQ